MDKNTVCIHGLGLIGASIARSLGRKYTIVGCDSNPEIEKYCLENNIIHAAKSVADFGGALCCFSCVPFTAVAESLESIYQAVGDTSVITDVCSLKSQLKGVRGRYVGGHPMAGTEKSGAAQSKEFLFENACYVLISDGNKDDLSVVEGLVKEMGAKPVIMSAARHDALCAAVSHMPHVAAYALVNSVSDALKADDGFVGTGFFDTTRIAGSDEEFWSGVVAENRENVLHYLDKYIEELSALRQNIAAKSDGEVKASFGAARALREKIGSGRQDDLTVSLDVPDRTGSLEGVLKVLSQNKISLANIGIFPARENSGCLRLRFYCERDREKAQELLKSFGTESSCVQSKQTKTSRVRNKEIE